MLHSWLSMRVFPWVELVLIASPEKCPPLLGASVILASFQPHAAVCQMVRIQSASPRILSRWYPGRICTYVLSADAHSLHNASCVGYISLFGHSSNVSCQGQIRHKENCKEVIRRHIKDKESSGSLCSVGSHGSPRSSFLILCNGHSGRLAALQTGIKSLGES